MTFDDTHHCPIAGLCAEMPGGIGLNKVLIDSLSFFFLIDQEIFDAYRVAFGGYFCLVLLDDSCSWVTVSLSVGSAMVTVYYLSSVLSKLLWGGLTRLYLSVQIYLYSFIKKRLREKNVVYVV
jgi:hypothetical protein